MKTDSWSLEEIDAKTRRIRGGGVTLDIPYSKELVEQLAVHRPGLDLLDELLRSEHTPYIQDRLALLLEPFPDRADWRALDFGCGAGGSSTVLARLGIGHIIGVDLVNDYAAIWRRRLEEAGYPEVGTFVQAGESLRLPFRDGSFDAVFLNGVLEHLVPEERRDLLAEARRLVRVGGYLFISETPNRWFPRNQLSVGSGRVATRPSVLRTSRELLGLLRRRIPGATTAGCFPCRRAGGRVDPVWRCARQLLVPA